MTRASRTLIAHLGGECNRPDPDPERIASLRQQIRDAQIREWAERQLTDAPPLSQATKDTLALLLNPGAGHGS